MDTKILAVDVGGGTQDILLYEEGKPVENCVQLVLPSQTVVVSHKITAATEAGKDICLQGELMGGGACVKAMKKHMDAGLKVYAAPQAAKTVRDDLERVKEEGVEIIDGDPPSGVEVIEMRDIVPANLQRALAAYEVELPQTWAVAVQDHGESPVGVSNRKFRFQHWQKFLQQDGDIRNLLYDDIPDYFTRMQAVSKSLPKSWLSDTGTAAIWGALGDPVVEEHREDGLIIVNIGNQHTVGVLLQGFKIYGLFEHHTKRMNADKLEDYVTRLRAGTLTNEEVFGDKGHGCYIQKNFQAGNAFRFVAVTGPQRHMAAAAAYHWAAPYGNMMLSGCYGLVAALKVKAGGQISLY